MTTSRPRTGNILFTLGDMLTYDSDLSEFTKRFPGSRAHHSRNEQIALQHLALHYSWNNLTAAFNNLTGCSYRWVDGQEYPVNYPEGFYEIENLNEYLHFTMRQNGHYLLDADGQEVFYLRFQLNQVYYAVTVTSTPVPSALPADWSNPQGVPLSGLAPQLLIGNTNWGKLIGFPPGSYPSAQGSSQSQFNSPIPPVISPVTVVQVICDWVNDGRFTTKPSVIASFVPDVPFGALISYTPMTLSFYDVIESYYSGISLRLVDQDYRPLAIKDISSVQFSLLLRSE